MTYENYEIRYKLNYLTRCDQLTKYNPINLTQLPKLDSLLLQFKFKEHLTQTLETVEKDEKELFLNTLNLFFFTMFGKPFFFKKNKIKQEKNLIIGKKKTIINNPEKGELTINTKISKPLIINTLVRLIKTKSLQIIILNNLKKKNQQFYQVITNNNTSNLKLKIPFSVFLPNWPITKEYQTNMNKINYVTVYFNFKYLPLYHLNNQNYPLINLLKDFQIL